MRSIKRRYLKIKERNPFWSDYTCFAEAVTNQSFSKDMISRWFNVLVDKSEYLKKEKREVIKHLMMLSKRAVDNEK
jgi:hypothetical protein